MHDVLVQQTAHLPVPSLQVQVMGKQMYAWQDERLLAFSKYPRVWPDCLTQSKTGHIPATGGVAAKSACAHSACALSSVQGFIRDRHGAFAGHHPD